MGVRRDEAPQDAISIDLPQGAWRIAGALTSGESTPPALRDATLEELDDFVSGVVATLSG